MTPDEIESIELRLLMDTLHRRHGYDFHGYSEASLKRRVASLATRLGFSHISMLIPPLLRDGQLIETTLNHLLIGVTEFYRDPAAYLTLRRQVIPHLRTYHHINLWVAGCSSGEEAYSIAILLQEEGLLERSRIYASDINSAALGKAEKGVFPKDHIKKAQDRYHRAGGKASLTDYFFCRYGYAKIDDAIRQQITFIPHNLVKDEVFCEAQLVVCRNVLIYFGRELQERALALFYDSLVRKGFLFLGAKESLGYGSVDNQFRAVAKNARIFQKQDPRPNALTQDQPSFQ